MSSSVEDLKMFGSCFSAHTFTFETFIWLTWISMSKVNYI